MTVLSWSLDHWQTLLDGLGRLVYAHVFWILSLLPGSLSALNHYFRVRQDVRSIENSLKPLEDAGANASVTSKDWDSIDQYRRLDQSILTEQRFQYLRPSSLSMLLAAAILTVVLGIVAYLSSGNDGVGLEPARMKDPGLAGLVFAAYGAYVYVMTRLISRLNTSAITDKFLYTSAIRVAIAMVLGYLAGAISLFSFAQGNASLPLYFLIGLFPLWTIEALQRKARDLFHPADPECAPLRLGLIDGLDDALVDRLEELGIRDIEHLATTDAGKLRLATLYPTRRILDWMDQAILISYVRQEIGEYRQFGVRGAIDLATLYGDKYRTKFGELIDEEDRGTRLARAGQIVQGIAGATKSTEDTIWALGRSLYEDSLVNRIWDLWQDEEDEAPRG